MERQNIYGWPVILDLFAGGTGAGAFAAGLMLRLFRTEELTARFMVAAGPLLVLCGTLFLFADINVKSRAHLLFANLKSWTARGAWVLALFLIAAFNYALLSSSFGSYCPPLNGSIPVSFLGAISAVLALLVIVYPGLLMGSIGAVPFWNTPLVAVLFLIAGLSDGAAFLLLVASIGASDLKALLHTAGPLLIALKLALCLAAYMLMDRAARGNEAAGASYLILERARFKMKLFVGGILLPALLLFFTAFLNDGLQASILSALAALLFLGGGLYLRRNIIEAGVFLPRFTLHDPQAFSLVREL